MSKSIDAAILLLVKAGYTVTRGAGLTATAGEAPKAHTAPITPPLLDLGGFLPPPAPTTANAQHATTAAASPKPHACGTCGEVGHNARTCPTTHAVVPPPPPPALAALDLSALGFGPPGAPKVQSSKPKAPAAAPSKPTPASVRPSAPQAHARGVSVGDIGGLELFLPMAPTAPAPTVASEASDSEVDALSAELEGLDLPDSLL